MPTITVAALVIDEVNEDKFWGDGGSNRRLTADQVLQVLEHPFVIVRNRKERRALYLLVGRDSSGTCIAIPIEPTYDPVVWRPITAWRCKEAEKALLR